MGRSVRVSGLRRFSVRCDTTSSAPAMVASRRRRATSWAQSQTPTSRSDCGRAPPATPEPTANTPGHRGPYSARAPSTMAALSILHQFSRPCRGLRPRRRWCLEQLPEIAHDPRADRGLWRRSPDPQSRTSARACPRSAVTERELAETLAKITPILRARAGVREAVPALDDQSTGCSGSPLLYGRSSPFPGLCLLRPARAAVASGPAGVPLGTLVDPDRKAVQPA